MPRKLTDKEIKIVMKHRLKMPGSAIAKLMKIGRHSVCKYLNDNNLNAPDELRAKWRRSNNTCSKKEENFIKTNYLKIPCKTMAKKLKRSSCFVKSVMKRFDLIVPDDLKAKWLTESQFKAGQEPFTKGKKITEYLTPEQIEKAKETWFKPGHVPHNTKHDGAISIRHFVADPNNPIPYKFIRVACDKWELLNRFNWEKNYGPIPENMCVSFIDGDSMNCEPENLKLVSRQELAKKNAGSVTLTDGFVAYALAGNKNLDLIPLIKEQPELIQLKRDQLLLRRQIKQHE